eukprot:403345584
MLIFSQIENALNKGLNEVLQLLPQDPLSLMAATLIDSIISTPVFDRFEARETVICEQQRTIKIKVWLQFNGKTLPYYVYTFPFNPEDIANFTFDKPDEKTGMKKACHIINEEISPLLKGKEILGFKKIDEILLAYQKKSQQSDEGSHVGDNIIRACSEAILFAYAFCTSPSDPYVGFFKFMFDRDYTSQEKTPRLMFTVLNGGKALGSKVKFSKIYLILDITAQDDVDIVEVYFKIQAQLRKQIQTHKLGENGFKPGADGSYFNAFETVNESFKFIEDAINTNERKKYIKFGINPDVDSSYIKEQNKYDLEGPKNLFDQDQLTEYFVKMCNEHPLLEYLEDPVAEGDVVGYQKIIKRFKDAVPRVKIGIKHMLKSNLDIIKQHTQIISKDDDDDDEEEKKEQEKKIEEEKKEQIPQVIQEPVSVKAGGRDSVATKKPAPSDMKTPANQKSQAKLEPLQSQQEIVQENLNDPNRLKFIPHIVHLEKSLLKTSYKLWEILIYQQLLKPEEQFEVIIEDNSYETCNSEVIDISFGAQVAYTNIRGFFRNEKSAKVQRFSEILDSIKQIQKIENQSEF